MDMRLDKYLKMARIIKRRTIAKGISDLGFVKVNNKEAKPSLQIKEGDIIELSLGDRIITVRVLNLTFSTRKEEAKESYEIIKDEFRNSDNIN